MNIGIIGAGGVGGYFGARLAQAGYNVTLIARGEHLAAIRKNGLQVRSIKGDFHVRNIAATEHIEDVKGADLILVCVKAWQIIALAGEIAAIVHPETIVLPLQNGVLALEELKESVDEKNLVGGLCRLLSEIQSPGVINHFGVEPILEFGEINRQETPRLHMLKDMFDNAGIKSVISSDIHADLWKKFIFICVSGLLAVTKTTYGELRETPELREMMINLMNEVHQLAEAMGISIAPDYVRETVAFIDTFPYDSTTSLARDVLNGRPSEIEYQNGTVVRLGQAYGVDTPVNQYVYYSILPLEKKARGSSLTKG